MDLKGKAVLVTGGSRGLGLGLVEVLVERGADVTVLARDRTVLTALETRLGVHIVLADVTDAAPHGKRSRTFSSSTRAPRPPWVRSIN